MVAPLLVSQDESVPVHPDQNPRHPLVIFGDHRFCAGEALLVQRMPGPHMHSQIELNFVLEGEMTYWFDGRELTVGKGRLCLFWGMIPHQVIDRAEGTRFVCLYVPMSFFLGLANLTRFRDAVFRGAMIEATERSISPEMMTSAMAKAIIAFSVKLKVASDWFQILRK